MATAIVGWGEPLSEGQGRATVAALASGAPWTILFNGRQLRLVDAQHPYVRQRADFDIALAAEDDTTFGLLRTLLRAATTAGPVPEHSTALHALAARSRAASLDVCGALRSGVLTASGLVTGALAGRRRDPPIDAAFEQALTIVYRVLFLLFAEARGLVPLWHPVYRTSYSIESLRKIAERRPVTPGLWDGLRAITRLAHAGCRLGELHVTPFNGRLFAPARHAARRSRDLDDEAAQRALLALTTTEGARRERIRVSRSRRRRAWRRVRDAARLRADRRAVVGSTPSRGCSSRSNAAHPPKSHGIVLHAAGDRRIHRPHDARRRSCAVAPDAHPPPQDPRSVRWAAARSWSRRADSSRWRTNARSSRRDRHTMRAISASRSVWQSARTVAERCLYGVDVEPDGRAARAVVALARDAGGRSAAHFLDHHLVAGDSLLGAWLSALRRPPSGARRDADEDNAAALRREAAH